MTFSFIIFLFLIKQFSFSLVNAQKYNSNPDNYLKNILSCIENYSNYSNVSLAQCIINETRNDTESFIDLLKNKNTYSMLKKNSKLEGFKETPYKSLMRMVDSVYIEILTYQTILINAKRRNKVFFKKLGIE